MRSFVAQFTANTNKVCWFQFIVQNLAHQNKIIPYMSTQPWRMGENRQGKIGKENKHLQKPKVLQKERIAHPPVVCHAQIARHFWMCESPRVVQCDHMHLWPCGLNPEFKHQDELDCSKPN
jgi:hypothetical protein